MSFNTDKFEHVAHGRDFATHKKIPKSEYFTADNLSIETKQSVRDLGIQISAASDFTEQINKVCKAVRDKTSWIFRTFYCREAQFMSFMWRTYVQPLIDYGCQLWAPNCQMGLKKLEDLLRNYTSRCDKTSDLKLNFWERVKFFGISSQQRRQQRFRVICTWKIMENLSPNCGISWTVSERGGETLYSPILPKNCL